MFFLKGILIGLLVGVPAGAIGALCVQRMLSYGTKSGFITGFASSVVDCFYCAVGIFGITLISDFMTKYESAIMLCGGLLILFMGLSTLRKTPDSVEIRTQKPPCVSMLLTAFGVGITNPAAILGFLIVFTYFGIGGNPTVPQGTFLIGGVFIGTTIWWVLLAMLTGALKRKFGENAPARLNRFFGVLMILFSILILSKAALSLIQNII
ncbi:MAG: LysE family transporter [Oscillospiraceae bacterium]|nr:LysE family transporter [Oscillospiraceae bacterium]